MKNKNYYCNVICEEHDEIVGGKIIHIDTNVPMNKVHGLVQDNCFKYPRAHWELHFMRNSMR